MIAPADPSTLEFIANPGGQAAFVHDWDTPVTACSGGTGSGKTEGLALLHHCFTEANRGISGWVAETMNQFRQVSRPKLEGSWNRYFAPRYGGRPLEFRDVGGQVGCMMVYPIPLIAGQQRDEWGSILGGRAAIMVRTAENAERIAGPDWTHASCDELDRWPIHPSDPKRDPWMQIPTRTRVPCRYNRIRAVGTHEGNGQLGRYFYKNGPEPLETCRNCGMKGGMKVVRDSDHEGKFGKSHGGVDRAWDHVCQACRHRRPAVRLYRASTRDNPHLSSSAIEKILQSHKTRERESYIDGHYMQLGAGRACGNWSDRNCAPVHLDLSAPWVGLCCDFNVDVLAWELIQPCGGCAHHEKAGSPNGGWHIVKEFRETGYASTAGQIAEVARWLRARGWGGPVRLMGDPNGRNRSQTTNNTDYGLIADGLGNAGFPLEWAVLTGYPRVKESLTLLNNLLHEVDLDTDLREVDRGCRILVNAGECPGVVEDFETARRREMPGEGGDWALDKSFYDPHGMDGIRYAIWALIQQEGMDEMPYAVAGAGIDRELQQRADGYDERYGMPRGGEIDFTKGWNEAEDFGRF